MLKLCFEARRDVEDQMRELQTTPSNKCAAGKGWIASLCHTLRLWPPCLSTNVRCENMRYLPLVLLLFAAVGCDQSQRKVAGPYRLERFESGKFYLEKAGVPESGGGCIEGTVEQIGWTNGFIFARRYATYRGDPDGWMVIDVTKQSVIGPLPEAEFRQKYPGVQTLPPEDAWKKL
jgi:hypothetical protein